MSHPSAGDPLGDDVLSTFRAVVADGAPALDDAVALIAAAVAPERVDPACVVGELDRLAERFVARGVGGGTSELCAWLFIDEGFTGNRADYYDPANSLLDQVLERRLGIPITLSLVAIEVGRRVGLPLVGVGMPGHFLLRDAADPDRYFDAFRSGLQLDREGCRAAFEVLHGESTPWDPAYLEPTSSLQIVRRILTNLSNAFARRDDQEGAARVLRLTAELPDSPVALRRRAAEVLTRLGRFDEAAAEYDELADAEPGRADEHHFAALRLRARLN